MIATILTVLLVLAAVGGLILFGSGSVDGLGSGWGTGKSTQGRGKRLTGLAVFIAAGGALILRTVL